jgi:hypothetical protein
VWIDRELAAHLQEVARHFPAVVLTGARQAGKTSLLRRTFPEAAWLPLDLPSAAHQAEHNPSDFLAARPEPLLIDEVQYAPRLFRHLKRAIDADRHRMGRFLMTGSQKFTLMRALSESLAGRCAVLELDTLSAREIRAALRRRAPGPASFIWRGGFPELYRDPEIPARDFYMSYVATYLERDVRLALQVGSLRDFERFLRACALRSAQLLNLAELARDVGIAGTTARDWLSVLEASNQVVVLEPYFGNVAKRLIKTPKLYLRDTGLLCFLLGLDSPDALERSPFIGPVWETFVLNQLLRAKHAASSAASVFFWRDAHGTEVDFVVEHEGRVRLIEAKWTEQLVDRRSAAAIAKVCTLLGTRAAAEHWIVTRTPHRHTSPAMPTVRVINGYETTDWLAP